MYPEIEFDILPPHLRNPFLKSGIYSQFTFQILFSEIFNSGFLDPISRNQRIRVFNYNELVVDEENKRCIYCEDKWCLGHKYEDPYLILFNPYDRDDEYVETQEEISENDIEQEQVEKIFYGVDDNRVFVENSENDQEEEKMEVEGLVLENTGCFVDDENGTGELETVVVEEVCICEGLEGFVEKPERKQDQRNCNGDCIEEACVDQLIFPDVDDRYNIFRNLEIQPRVGVEYQAENPPIFSKSQLQLYKTSPFEPISKPIILTDFLIGLPIPLMPIHKEAELEKGPLLCRSAKEKKAYKKHLSKGYCLVPAGSLNGSWSEIEERHFLLGLHICGKDLVLVKKFVEEKPMGDNQSYYYAYKCKRKLRNKSNLKTIIGKNVVCFSKKKRKYEMSRLTFDPGGKRRKNWKNINQDSDSNFEAFDLLDILFLETTRGSDVVATKRALLVVVLLQHVPRFIRIIPLISELKRTSVVFAETVNSWLEGLDLTGTPLEIAGKTNGIYQKLGQNGDEEIHIGTETDLLSYMPMVVPKSSRVLLCGQEYVGRKSVKKEGAKVNTGLRLIGNFFTLIDVNGCILTKNGNSCIWNSVQSPHLKWYKAKEYELSSDNSQA